MNKELKDITITVYATQDTVESDSFNNQYDENATYPVVNVTELKEALTNGGVVAVTEDIQTNNIEDTAAARIVISQPTTLNLEKKIITPDNMGNNNTNFCALIIDADTTINAGENGGIDTGVTAAMASTSGRALPSPSTAATITAAVLLCRSRRVRWSSMAAPLPLSHSAIRMAATSRSTVWTALTRMVRRRSSFRAVRSSTLTRLTAPARTRMATSCPMVTRSCLRLRPTATFGILWLLSNSLHQKERSPRNGESALLMCDIIPTPF